MALSEVARALRNAYYRDYKKKHKDKISKQNDEYWNRKAEKLQQEQLNKKEK